MARRAIYAQETGEVFLFLLTLSHPQLLQPIRVVNNNEDVTSDGFVYQRFPFDVHMPPENEDAPPKVNLRVAGADRTLVQAVRSLSGEAMTAELSVVLASSPDTIEAGPLEFKLRDVTYEAAIVEGSLQFEDFLSEPYPADKLTPDKFPGLF
ncbi:MAG: DUF1833 family protein [Phycisphaerales bacterium]|nr:MAG: DUF1833 family protein [Phycisphaerales bacterium]